MRYFEKGGQVPLMAKAERKSTVHRRVPLDLVVVPILEKKKVVGIGVHAGLWTSEALRVPPEDVPVLRERLKQLDEDFGFDSKGHSGKALRHAIGSLPRDLLITVDYDSVRKMVMMAMSLADRPRPALLQVRSILQGQLFTLRLAAARGADHRTPHGDRHAARAGGRPRDHELVGRAWRRRSRADPLHPYIDEKAADPDSEALDAAVVEMVRGWAPAVEAELIDAAGVARATRLALTYINAFPDGYRARTAPRKARPTFSRLCELSDDSSRDVRVSRVRQRFGRPAEAQDLPERRAHPAFRGGSGAGKFRIPRARGNADGAGGGAGYIHDFRVEIAGETDVEPILARASQIENAIANVLRGDPRTTSSISSFFMRVSKRRQSSGCDPGSATCARPAAALAW